MRLLCTSSLLLLLCVHLTSGINPNELKPCFERYDGFKIVDAVPFHSEWRMKVEEWCLEFCVRASSRCVSIVYDKQSRICHYFSVNGIEGEKITKHPRMVYFQIAERQCTERMQKKIEQEEKWREQQFEMRQTTPEAKVNEEASQTNTVERNETIQITPELIPTTKGIEVTTLTETTSTFPSEATTVVKTNTLITRTVEAQTKQEEEEEFDGDPMSFVNRFQFETEGAETTTDPLFPIQQDRIFATTTRAFTTTTQETNETRGTDGTRETDRTGGITETTRATETIKTVTEQTQSSSIERSTPQPQTVNPSTTTQIPSSTPTASIKESTTTVSAETVASMTSLAENAAAGILPVMNSFKAVRRPLPEIISTNAEEKKPVETIELRRSPSRPVNEEAVYSKYTGKRPVAQKMEDESEPSILPADDDETMLADNSPVVDDCPGGTQEIWLAVENSQVKSSVRTSIIKISTQPTECMEACQTLFIGRHPCDSFTFIEPAKRCLFHSSHSGFQVKPSALNDFSTRAFRRFCYPESLTPFSDCAEFLAFRDYTLDIPPREIFEDLPLGNEGMSACIELCVLSNEFRCNSASFNTKNGSCMIFDEHSLSKPEQFKVNTDPNRLYFENGCIEMKIPESVVKESKVQRVPQAVLLDYRKLSVH